MRALNIMLMSCSLLVGTSSLASLHEAYETVAICSPKEQSEFSRIRVMDSTSSTRAVLELHKPAEPAQEDQFPEHIEGWKDDSVRDPIVWQYEFKGYELLISLERGDDDLYAASLVKLTAAGERSTEKFLCQMK